MTIKLYNGECIQTMKDYIPDHSIDFILCDLPYGMVDCEWDSIINFSDLWEQYNRIIKENGAIALFSAESFTSKVTHSNLKYYKYSWYWIKNNKSNFQNAKKQPLRCVELINIFYKKQPTYNPQGVKSCNILKSNKRKCGGILATSSFDEGRIHLQTQTGYPTNVLEFKLDKERLHPTQKPVPLLEYLIRTYTHEGETVLDNCMGSGSTGVAAANTNRNFIGIELDAGYYATASERIEAAKKAQEEKQQQQEAAEVKE